MSAGKSLSRLQNCLSTASANTRAVHLRIHPRPQNLAQSRQVLRVLEQYGEVIVFKNLRVGSLNQGLTGRCDLQTLPQ